MKLLLLLAVLSPVPARTQEIRSRAVGAVMCACRGVHKPLGNAPDCETACYGARPSAGRGPAATPSGGGYNPQAAAQAAFVQGIGGAISGAFQQNAAKAAVENQQMQRSLNSLSQQRAAEAAADAAARRDKQRLSAEEKKLETLKGLKGSTASGELGFKAPKGPKEVTHTPKLDFKQYRENERSRREGLEKAKKMSKKDEDWCKLHIPVAPTASTYDPMGQDKSRQASYASRKAEWDRRCGGRSGSSPVPTEGGKSAAEPAAGGKVGEPSGRGKSSAEPAAGNEEGAPSGPEPSEAPPPAEQRPDPASPKDAPTDAPERTSGAPKRSDTLDELKRMSGSSEDPAPGARPSDPKLEPESAAAGKDFDGSAQGSAAPSEGRGTKAEPNAASNAASAPGAQAAPKAAGAPPKAPVEPRTTAPPKPFKLERAEPAAAKKADLGLDDPEFKKTVDQATADMMLDPGRARRELSRREIDEAQYKRAMTFLESKEFEDMVFEGIMKDLEKPAAKPKPAYLTPKVEAELDRMAEDQWRTEQAIKVMAGQSIEKYYDRLEKAGRWKRGTKPKDPALRKEMEHTVGTIVRQTEKALQGTRQLSREDMQRYLERMERAHTQAR